MIDVEVLEVVVKIDTARAKVATQKCCVRCEDGGDIDVAFPAEGDGNAGLPFVKMSYHDLFELSGDVLRVIANQYSVTKRWRIRLTSPRNHATM